jgi:predicted metal-dependent phosphoesterase TrpH
MRANLRADALDALVDAGLVDALEVRNAKTSLEHLNREAVDYAEARSLLAGAGSDAHVPAALGAAYVEMPDFDGPVGFADALARGRIVGHHFDEPRPWTPRIVPSAES